GGAAHRQGERGAEQRDQERYGEQEVHGESSGSCSRPIRRSSRSSGTSSLPSPSQTREARASRKVVTPKVVTIAVSAMAWGGGSESTPSGPASSGGGVMARAVSTPR